MVAAVYADSHRDRSVAAFVAFFFFLDKGEWGE